MSDIVLDVVVREDTGTGAARAVRRDGGVPGTLYGGGKDPIAIALRQNEVLRAINSGKFLANMIEISHSGEKQSVITQDVQFHPVTDMPVHIDFYRVDKSSIITVEVSVNILGEEECPGLKEGGALNVVRHAIEVSCPAGSIPDQIDVDVSKLDIGDAVHISDVTLPENVTPAIDDRDFTIVTVTSTRALEEEDEDGEEDIEAGDVPTVGEDEDGAEGEGEDDSGDE